jgi:hypothetical protein
VIQQIKAGNQGIIDFLLTDLDIALIFLDVAETTEFRDTAERNHRNARNAYETVVAKLREITLTAEQQALFEPRLAVLKARLQAIGQL